MVWGKLLGKNETEFLIHIYESEYYSIIAEIKDFSMETGGDLFGTFTHGNLPVVWWASGPGPKSQKQRTEFSQDTEFTTQWQRYLMENFGIQYIGTWHSHHQLGLNKPSRGDEKAVKQYARRHNRQRSIEIIVTIERNEVILRPYFYPDAQSSGWVEANFRLIRGESPIRQRLSADGHSVSNDWQMQKKSYRGAAYQYVASPSDDHSQLDIEVVPSANFQNELENLDCNGVSIDWKKEDKFIVTIPLDTYRFVAIAVQDSAELGVLQVNYFDRHRNINKDITQDLINNSVISHQSQTEKQILKRIFMYIQHSEYSQ